MVQEMMIPMHEDFEWELYKEISEILKIALIEDKVICWRNVEVSIDQRLKLAIKLKFHKKVYLTNSLSSAAYYILRNVYFEAIIIVRNNDNGESP